LNWWNDVQTALEELVKLIADEKVHSLIDDATLESLSKTAESNKKITWNRIVEALITCIAKESQKVLQKSLSKKTIQSSLIETVSVFKQLLKSIEARKRYPLSLFSLSRDQNILFCFCVYCSKIWFAFF
jgi:hypothetical protein